MKRPLFAAILAAVAHTAPVIARDPARIDRHAGSIIRGVTRHGTDAQAAR